MLLGVLLLFVDFLPFLVVFAIIWLVFIIRWPILGLISYVLVILLRPGEVLGIPFVAKAVAGACIFAWLVRYVLPQKPMRVTAAYKAMLFFVASVGFSAVSAFWIQQVFDTWQDSLKLLVLYTITISFVDTSQKLAIFGTAVLAAVGYTGAYVIYNIAVITGYSGQRIHELAWGMFSDSNEFSQIIVMLLPILVLLLIEIKGLKWRLFSCLMIAIGMVIMVLSASRGGFLGLLIICVALWLRGRRKMLLLIVVAASMGALLLLAPSSLFERLGSITQYSQDESSLGRLEAWSAGLRMFLRNPVSGIGAGCFDYASLDYGLSKELVAHNSFITVVAETGLIGLISYLCLIYYTFQGCRRIRSALLLQGRQGGLIYVLSEALPISLIGFIATSMFISTTYYPQLFILCATVTAADNIIAHSEEATGLQ